VLLVIGWLTGADPQQLLNIIGGLEQMIPTAGEQAATPAGSQQDELAQFAGIVLTDTEETWTRGSYEMCTQWFRRSLDSGDAAACDTFNPR
jgi:predicted metalloprotease